MAGRTPSAPPTRLLSQEPFNVSTHLAKAAFQLSCLRDASGISLFLSVVLGRVPDFKRTWEAEIDTCRSPTLHRLWDVLQPGRIGRPRSKSAGPAGGLTSNGRGRVRSTLAGHRPCTGCGTSYSRYAWDVPYVRVLGRQWACIWSTLTLNRLWDVPCVPGVGRSLLTGGLGSTLSGDIRRQAAGVPVMHADPGPAVGRPMRTGCSG